MKFKIYDDVFDKLPDLCFGAVVAYDVDNTKIIPEIFELLSIEMSNLQTRLEGKNLKEQEGITKYRETFRELGMNPNKFMSSIEAMAKRVSKGGKLPSINGIVDLGNSVS